MNVEKLDITFSKFVRLSYADENGFVECFTCPKKLHWKELQNGHFIKRSNMSTRFSMINCKPQCDTCNKDCHYNGSKQKVFENTLRKLYGDKVIDDLIEQGRKIRKYAQFEIDFLNRGYKEKNKELIKLIGQK